MKGYIYLIGGFDGEKLNDIWRLGVHELESKCIKHSSNTPRPNNPYNILDTPKSSKKSYFNTPRKLEIAAKSNETIGTWTRLGSFSQSDKQPIEPEERTGHSLLFDNKYLYVLGGVNSKSICLDMKVIDCYDFQMQEWSKKITTGTPPTVRSSIQNSFLFDIGIAIYFGGYFVDQFYNDCFALDCSQLAWSCLSKNLQPVTRRAYFSMNRYQESIYIFGGRGKLEIYRCLYKLTYNSRTKSIGAEEIISIGERPSERFGHCASVIESSL